MLLYFDESGDLGWKFDKPYGFGGSSRYLTIVFMLIPRTQMFLPMRIVKAMYHWKNWSPKEELKGTNLNFQDKRLFLNHVSSLLKTNNEIKLYAITVNKSKVDSHIRNDQNLIYNYMTSLIIPEAIMHLDQVTMYPDPRSIKVGSKDTLRDYLQTKLWFEYRSKTILKQKLTDSSKCLNLQFVDFLSNIIWSHYERGEQALFHQAQQLIDNRVLFFHNHHRP